MSIADIMQTFFAESRALLADLEQGLLQLEGEPDDREALDAVFRAVHTIKGSAGLFSLDRVVEFTHVAENVLVRARDGRLLLDGDSVALLLRCGDHLQLLLEAAADQSEPDADAQRQHAALSRELEALLGGGTDAPPPTVPAVIETRAEAADAASAVDDAWHISVRFSADLFRKGLSPTPILRQLATLGELTHVVTIADGLPAAAAMDPESCYLGFELRLRGDIDKAAIDDAFEFAMDDCDLRILPPGSRVQDYVALIDTLPEDNARLGEMLLACGAVTRRELDALLSIQEAERALDEPPRPIGQIAVDEHSVRPEVVDAALNKQREARQRSQQEAQLIRVQSAKLDRLIDKVGELVIASAGVGQIATRLREAGLLEAVSGMARLVEDIRDSAMRLRMVEIGETFGRFRRVVFDVSRQVGKDIELSLAGGETELDKGLVEQITDPLTHLVRNAIDHGIEPAAERRAAGKPTRGRLRLAASHESSSVVVEVSDDGRGLSRDRILAKARQRGMVDDDEALSDAEVWNLIFEPGFSTAEQVSNLSGRGVGMDVVRRNIEALRGTIEIDSRPGHGTTFRIRLPLTLAIIDGFLVGVGGSYYVAPLDTVIECVEFEREATERGYLNLRGEVLPLLRLREHFDLPPSEARRQSVVVVSVAGRKAGLVVDRLDGELQTVIKPLGPLFAALTGISGSSILGSGEIALVLDVPALLGEAARSRPALSSPTSLPPSTPEVTRAC